MIVRIKAILLIFLLIFSLCGCDAFVRKFKRKPKKEISFQKEMVLVPEEYASLFADKEERYRYYFSFWQSWHMEFINSLVEKTSHKKKISCISEAIKNLEILKDMFSESKKSELERYIQQLKDLRHNLLRDIYTTQFNWYYNRAEMLRKAILREFSYHKVKDYLR